jgi:hypothetical protein
MKAAFDDTSESTRLTGLEVSILRKSSFMKYRAVNLRDKAMNQCLPGSQSLTRFLELEEGYLVVFHADSIAYDQWREYRPTLLP